MKITIIKVVFMIGVVLAGGSSKSGIVLAEQPGATVTSPVFIQQSQSMVQSIIVRDLSFGTRGDDVKILQEALSTISHVYPEKLITGYFGPLTKKAVEKLQTFYKIPVTGVVNGETLRKVNEIQSLTKNVATISDLKTSSLSPSSSLISWNTNVPATTEVYYSKAPHGSNATQTTIKDLRLTKSHAVEIAHLQSSTKYYFTIASISLGNVATSTVQGEFVTPAN